MLTNLFEPIRSYFESRAFGVCNYIGDRFNISTNKLRVLFIYGSCLTIGSPIIIYFTLYALIQGRKYLKTKRTVWEL